jgi:molybdopterin converting factor small subunit
MKITVKLFANLVKFSPNPSFSGAPFELDLPEAATLAEVVNILQLPADEVKVLFVNGIICEPEKILQPNDTVGIFPPVGGGSQ